MKLGSHVVCAAYHVADFGVFFRTEEGSVDVLVRILELPFQRPFGSAKNMVSEHDRFVVEILAPMENGNGYYGRAIEKLAR